MKRERLFTLLVLLASTAPVFGASFVIEPERSIIAVVTHKAGFASGLAHDHLIAAEEFEASLEFEDSRPFDTKFEFRTRAVDLVVDRADLREAWFPRLRELGILTDPLKELGEKQRGKVRRAMLGKTQLSADSFPRISASIVGVTDGPEAGFPYRVTLALEVVGQRVERAVDARYERSGAALVIEASGLFRFRDFGIKPYSAMLGAVRNRDEFHVYVRLIAHPAGS